MRTEADEFKIVVVGFPVDKNQIWPDMAVAVIAPLTRERMIKIPRRQDPVGS